MNLKQFRSKGGSERWAKMTDEQKKAHIDNMVKKRKEKALLRASSVPVDN